MLHDSWTSDALYKKCSNQPISYFLIIIIHAMLETGMQTILNFRTLDQENHPPWLETHGSNFNDVKFRALA